MSDFYRLKKRQSGFGVGTFRILDLSTSASVIRNICSTWGVQMVLHVLELIRQRIDLVRTDSSLRDKLNELYLDAKAGTYLTNTAAYLEKERAKICRGVEGLRYHTCKLHVCRDSLAAMDSLLDGIYREEKRASFLVRCAFKRIKLIGRRREFLERRRRRSKLQALWRHRRKHATWALQKIPGLLSQLQALKTENDSLKRRLISRCEDPVVDLTGSDDNVEARPAGNQLLAVHAQATNERLVEVKREVVDQRERADDQGTNAMYLTAQKSELQRLVSDAAGALIEADVPTHECPDGATPFYYMLESHRDDGKQTVPWNPEAGRAMSLAEGIEWARTNRPAKRRRRTT